jgi:hypothetical protein
VNWRHLIEAAKLLAGQTGRLRREDHARQCSKEL